MGMVHHMWVYEHGKRPNVVVKRWCTQCGEVQHRPTFAQLVRRPDVCDPVMYEKYQERKRK